MAMKSEVRDVSKGTSIRVNVCSQNCGDFFPTLTYVSIGSTHLSSTHLGQFTANLGNLVQLMLRYMLSNLG